MKLLKSNKGMTLVEIVVALAILGILIVPILSMFDLSISQIFDSGFRTQNTMVVQEDIDIVQEYNNLKPFTSDAEVNTYLQGLGYNSTHIVIVPVNASVFGVAGWNISLKKQIGNGLKTVELSTFIVNLN